eukprot:CAMPEP_0173377364 /NCGR_PEP_ID=MMETSP1356-20130122/563_1 /TAXON_ID=77927 ORGANISM="Hemiselmis virescens, Strain PCC157" /NCGR_SAMPLE_ID=MMETSP1356 /ASSEMBLY_ACC=CAM_ASM_000847 /LENGTH=126 /DNA_ID=CAMNT_0014330051 /DNA_START=13 /DNA_END=393 /DNA_ORIENTATION=+
MQKIIFIGALLLAVLALALAQGPVVLTADNFEAETEGKAAFVKFYAPWCGHCVALAPAWESLASKVASIDNAVVGKVDCTIEQELAGKYGIKGYPTLMMLKDGEQIPYRGARDEDSLLAFVKNHAL